MDYPRRIVCLTEESVEIIYTLGQQSRLVGVSSYVKRPSEATSLPKVSSFIKCSDQKIRSLDPDLILGYSDVQKEMASQLIGEGYNVFVANHRSLDEIFDYVLMLSSILGEKNQGIELIANLKDKITQIKLNARQLRRASKVYFEEWDDPMISAIKWVAEIIEIAGGQCITKNYSNNFLAKDRIVDSEFVIKQNPDIIFSCWCGKKMNLETITSRPGWDKIEAVKRGRIYELEPEIFLQPGIAPITHGLDILLTYFQQIED